MTISLLKLDMILFISFALSEQSAIVNEIYADDGQPYDVIYRSYYLFQGDEGAKTSDKGKSWQTSESRELAKEFNRAEILQKLKNSDISLV